MARKINRGGVIKSVIVAVTAVLDLEVENGIRKERPDLLPKGLRVIDPPNDLGAKKSGGGLAHDRKNGKANRQVLNAPLHIVKDQRGQGHPNDTEKRDLTQSNGQCQNDLQRHRRKTISRQLKIAILGRCWLCNFTRKQRRRI